MVTLLILLASFILTIKSSIAGISDVVRITIGKDRYFIVLDCTFYIICIITYTCVVGVIIRRGVFIMKFVIYRIFVCQK